MKQYHAHRLSTEDESWASVLGRDEESLGISNDEDQRNGWPGEGRGGDDDEGDPHVRRVMEAPASDSKAASSSGGRRQNAVATGRLNTSRKTVPRGRCGATPRLPRDDPADLSDDSNTDEFTVIGAPRQSAESARPVAARKPQGCCARLLATVDYELDRPRVVQLSNRTHLVSFSLAAALLVNMGFLLGGMAAHTADAEAINAARKVRISRVAALLVRLT